MFFIIVLTIIFCSSKIYFKYIYRVFQRISGAKDSGGKLMRQTILVKEDGDKVYYLYNERDDWFVRNKKQAYTVESKGGIIIIEPPRAITQEELTAIAEKIAWLQTFMVPKDQYSKKKK